MQRDLVRPEELWRHLFHPDRGYLVTASSSGEDWSQRCWRYPEEAREAAESVIEQAQLSRNAYLGVHLYRRFGNRRADNTVRTVRALWLDEDNGRYPGEGPQPTAIVSSSATRRHLYWRLRRSIPVEQAVDLNRRIAEWAGGDRGKAGLSSVLRPPGTGNFKREQPDLVGGYLTGVGEWEPEVIDQAVPVVEVEVHRPRRPYAGATVDLAPYLDAVDVIGPAPDGSAVKFSIVCPWSHQHSHGDKSGTYLMQFPSGAAHFECKHEHCKHRKWPEFRKHLRNRVRVRFGPHAIDIEEVSK
jgi:RepB DNA-primase from phage plasmid